MKKRILLIPIVFAAIVVLFQGCSKDDTTFPVIILNGDAVIIIGKGDAFTDPMATASDDEDGTITVTSDASTSVDVNEADVYTVTYTASDKAGNTATLTRTVIVNWKGSQLDDYTYTNIESDSAFGTVFTDSVGATVSNSSLSDYHFSFTPIFQHTITAPFLAEVHDGHHFTIEAQKPNGAGSLVTVEGIGEGTISHTGLQIFLNFQVMVTDSGSTPPDVAYCTIYARSN